MTLAAESLCEMLKLVRNEKMTISEMASHIERNRSTVTAWATALAELGMLECRQRGNLCGGGKPAMEYWLSPAWGGGDGRLQEVVSELDTASAQMERALVRWKDLVA